MLILLLSSFQFRFQLRFQLRFQRCKLIKNPDNSCCTGSGGKGISIAFNEGTLECTTLLLICLAFFAVFKSCG